jgi:hypothetical protein
MNTPKRFGFFASYVAAATAFLFLVISCCHSHPCTHGHDCHSADNGGAGGGFATVGFTGPSAVACPSGNVTVDCSPTNPALPKCARWSSCEFNNSGGGPAVRVCTYVPTRECIEGQVLACSSTYISKGVMTCDTTSPAPNACKFNPFTGPGTCRRCGTQLGDPCCPGPSACAAGTCTTDTSNVDNKYTGVCL